MSLQLAPVRSFPSSSLLARALRFAASLGRALMHRRDVVRLLDLDERGLKDIGLVRSDVVGALGESWDRDPSTLLMLRSVERRVRARNDGTRAAARRPGGYLP